jgi:pilus assembly protein CpaD
VNGRFFRKDMTMRSKLVLFALASGLAGCTTPAAMDDPTRGVEAVNVPVVTTADYVFDGVAPGGRLAPGETERLNGWFQGLGVGFGDTIYVDGAYGSPAASQVAQVAGRYGMMVQPGAPVTEGVVQPGTVRVVVSRRRAEVPGCPNWSRPAQPNFENKTLSNFGCGVNTNLAAMVADPVDLLRGREGTGVSDAVTAAKAVGLYRSRPPSGQKELKDTSSKGGN